MADAEPETAVNGLAEEIGSNTPYYDDLEQAADLHGGKIGETHPGATHPRYHHPVHPSFHHGLHTRMR